MFTGSLLQLFFPLSNATSPQKLFRLSVTVRIMRARNHKKRFSYFSYRGESIFKDSVVEFVAFDDTDYRFLNVKSSEEKKACHKLPFLLSIYLLNMSRAYKCFLMALRILQRQFKCKTKGIYLFS